MHPHCRGLSLTSGLRRTFGLVRLASRVSDNSAMTDEPEPRRFPPPWFAEKGADSKFADRYLYWGGVEALGSVGR
jgi:hypothetical protein